MNRFEPKKFLDICTAYSKAKFLTHHSKHMPENHLYRIENEVRLALEMMTYAFDGILDFDSKQEFVY